MKKTKELLKVAYQQLSWNKEALYYGAVLLYIIATTFQYTTFNNFPKLAKLFALCRYFSFFACCLKIGVDVCDGFISNYKNIWLYLIKIATLFVLCLIVSITAKEYTMLFLCSLLIGAVGIDVDSLLKRIFYVELTIFIVCVISSLFGQVSNLIFYRDEMQRFSLGYIHPNVLSSYVFFILAMYIWVSKTPFKSKELFYLMLINILIYAVTNTRVGFICITMLIIISCTKGNLISQNKYIKLLIDWFPFLVLLITVLLCLTFHSGIGYKINSILSGRTELTRNAFLKYGINLFGNNITWVAHGNYASKGLESQYNFVDNGFALFIFNFGYIISIVYFLYLSKLCKYLREKRTLKQLFIWLLVLILCFVEPRLYFIEFNPFMLFGNVVIENFLFRKPKISNV